MSEAEHNTTEVSLPPVVNGELASVTAVKVVAKKTRPPKRYTEGLLIEDMDQAAKFVADSAQAKLLKRVSGIGRPATRPPIIEGLKRRGLLKNEVINKKKYIISTEAGRALIAALPPEFYDIAETARWEAELDIIAEGKAASAEFENRLVEQVTERVQILKKLKPSAAVPRNHVRNTSSRNKGAVMSDPSAVPSDNQIAFAEKISAAFGVPLPDGLRTSRDVCKAFLDQHAGKPFPPTEKQLGFANRIASNKGVSIPSEVLADAKQLSAWIDANK